MKQESRGTLDEASGGKGVGKRGGEKKANKPPKIEKSGTNR